MALSTARASTRRLAQNAMMWRRPLVVPRLAASSSTTSSPAPPSPHPAWVQRLNASLAAHPAETAAAYVALDAASVGALFGALTLAAAPVPPDFAVAFAASRLLRRARLPLDALAAAALARAYPPLTLVKPSRLFGIAAQAAEAAVAPAAAVRGAAAPAAAPGAAAPAASSASAVSVPASASAGGALSRASAALAAAVDAYGLAFLVAQRLVGLASVSTLYALVSRGLDVEALLASIGLAGAAGGAAGAALGHWAAAAVGASVLYPAVIVGAGYAGAAAGAMRAAPALAGGGVVPTAGAAARAALGRRGLHGLATSRAMSSSAAAAASAAPPPPPQPQPPAAPSPSPPPPPPSGASVLHVLYDGDCPLCRGEIALLRRTRVGADAAKTRFVDVSSRSGEATGEAAGAAAGDRAAAYGLDGAALLAEMHVAECAAGPGPPRVLRVHRRVAAFRSIYTHLFGLSEGALAWTARAPFDALLDAAYAGFLRARPSIGRLLRRLGAERAR